MGRSRGGTGRSSSKHTWFSVGWHFVQQSIACNGYCNLYAVIFLLSGVHFLLTLEFGARIVRIHTIDILMYWFLEGRELRSSSHMTESIASTHLEE